MQIVSGVWPDRVRATTEGEGGGEVRPPSLSGRGLWAELCTSHGQGMRGGGGHEVDIRVETTQLNTLSNYRSIVGFVL